MIDIRPELAESIEPVEIAALVGDSNICFEQKLDGVRLMIVVEDGDVHGVNRNNIVAVDPQIAMAAQQLGDKFVLDGELLGGKFYVFDMPVALDLVTPDTPYSHRRTALEPVFSVLSTVTNKIELLPSFTASDDKVRLAKWCLANDTEGILAKNVDSAYRSGQRTADWLKAKFVKTCDVFISGLMLEGKRNAGIGLYDLDGSFVDVGTVSMTDQRLHVANIGDVLEVKYLYASDDRKLVQPRVLRFRNDKTAPQCTVEQLKFTNKNAIYRKDTVDH